jgi:hypothetical protein
MKDYRNFEQFVAKYLKESRGMLNESVARSVRTFQKATVTIEKKILEKRGRESMPGMSSGGYAVDGKVALRFNISDFGTFEIVATGGDLGRSTIDSGWPFRQPSHTRPKFISGGASGGGFRKIATVANQTGVFLLGPEGMAVGKNEVFFQSDSISFYQDDSDGYYPRVVLSVNNKKYDFGDLF